LLEYEGFLNLNNLGNGYYSTADFMGSLYLGYDYMYNNECQKYVLLYLSSIIFTIPISIGTTNDNLGRVYCSNDCGK